MNQYIAQETAVIDASAETIYRILIDYNDLNAHPAITPKHFFTKIEVVSGGIGDGTVVDVHCKVLGQTTQLTMTLIEAEKNRHLIEQDEANGVRSEFFLRPINENKQTEVTIKTTGALGGGLRGWIEKRITPRLLRPIYAEELENLNQVAMTREQALV